MTSIIAGSPSPSASLDAKPDLLEATLRRRRRLRRRDILLGVATPLLLLVVWELLVRTSFVDGRFFPAPSKIVQSGIEILTEPGQAVGFLFDVSETLRRLLIGYVIGGTAGVTLGVFMGLYRPVRAALAPLLYATFPTPKIAIFPLLLVIFGIGDASKISLVVLGVFFMTCINTLSGVLHAAPIYRDVAKAFRLPRLTVWTRIVVPSALPAIIAGLRLALGQALILVVAAEFVAANTGLGQFIWNAWQSLDIARMFLGLVTAALIGVCVMLLGNIVERRFIPWSRH